jgi:TonB-linked SusC/RagA family outer membrane protein
MKKNPEFFRIAPGTNKFHPFFRVAYFILLVGFCSISVFGASNQQPQKSIKITGTVSDASNGDLLPGATVTIKRTTIGTITDTEGKYAIVATDDNAVLVVSFIGYKSLEVPMKGKTTINIKLSPDVKEIEDVVVVGYGAQKKESVVGAISQTSGDQLKKMNVPQIANSLTGLIPGMVTIKTTGLPGGFNTAGLGNAVDYDQRTKIYLRGQSSWNGAEPLVLVDGVERSIDDVDPTEVEGISVLKDASATSVFGVRGANGVILVTTKRGQESKPRLTFDGQYSASFISKIATVMGSYDALEFKNRTIVRELAVSPTSWAYYTPKRYLDYYKTQEYPELFPDVNWRDYMLKDFASSYKLSVNLSGGTRFLKYFGSFSYTHEGGIIDGKDLGTGVKPGIDYDRMNVRTNLDFQFTSTTKVSLNLFGSYNRQTDVSSAGSNWRIWTGVYQRPRDLIPVYYADGVLAETGSHFPNPYAQLNYGGMDYANRVDFTTDLKVTQKLDMITKGLSAGITVSYDNTASYVGPRISATPYKTEYRDPRLVDATNAADSAKYITYVTPSTSNGYDWVMSPTIYSGDDVNNSDVFRQINYEFRIDYARQFGRHSVSGLALMTRQENAGGSSFASKRESWVGRLTYDYDSRYFFEANAGYNGSEKFDRKYRFGLFPSAAVGWMISNEQFFKNAVPWWNTLKIRYTYGLVGSDAGIARWLYVSSWNVYGGRDRIFGVPTGQLSGYTLSEEGAIANPEIHWETARKQNLGFDFGLFNDKLKATVELFHEYRYDVFNNQTTNVIFGNNLPPANIGKTRNKGYEAEISYNQVFSSGLGVSIKATHGYAKDNILYKDGPELTPAYQKPIGFQIDQTRSYLSAGIIQSWDELYTTVLDASNSNRLPGDYKSVDFNADGVIDSKDVVPYGYPSRPQHTYSFTPGITYKGFSFSAMFYGVYNVTINQDYYNLFQNGYSIVYPWQRNESWMPEYRQTTSAKMNAARYSSAAQTIGTAQYNMVDGSYLRLQNIELAYSLSEKQVKRLGVGSVRFYITGYDLLFFSKLRENRDNAARGEGGTIGSYPLMKRVTLGLTLGL